MIDLLEKLKENIKERNAIKQKISNNLIGKKFIITKDYFSNIYSSTGTNYKGRTCIVKSVRIDSNGNINCFVMILNYKTNKHSIRYLGTINYEDLRNFS